MVKIPYTLTYTKNGVTNSHTIYLPNDDIVRPPSKLNIKFYQRGNDYPALYYAYWNKKKPRKNTQLYINGKYFLNFNFITTTEFNIEVETIIKILYSYGLELEEIKAELKQLFYFWNQIIFFIVSGVDPNQKL